MTEAYSPNYGRLNRQSGKSRMSVSQEVVSTLDIEFF